MSNDKTPPEDLEETYLPETVADSLQQIGPYHLLDKLGEGGMGEVWLAEQTEPVRRKIALKIIKLGMDTKEVVARFEAERQALALMDHPSIARAYDAGATPNGRPYFVMELVPGVPITEHCDRHKLTNRQRLDLFMQVCEGVQHAHQKAVIHRDLKPSNVLVTLRDDKPVPKIIDFGVAKATAQKLTDRTMHTQLGAMIGTPEYMSPEQAELTGQDVDTRTDVYALGVMLYELLVGALPFDPKEFQQAGLEGMVRKICEDEPPKPSTRLSTLGEHSTQSAERRRTELPALKRELSGDLDWITMKALEKDRTRRYSSPQELAADLERYRTHLPVLARPPSVAYRAKKFVRRHKVGVSVAAGLVVLLLGFGVSMSVLYMRAVRAEMAMAKEARTAQQALDFMTGMFEVSDPSEARGNSITARELLDRGAETFDRELVDQPEVQARLMATMGKVYINLGLYAQARPLLEQAVEKRRELLGENHPETLNDLNRLAELYWSQGRGDEARRLLETTLETQRRVLGNDHPDTLRSLNGLAVLYVAQGDYDEAESLYLESLEIRRRVLGESHPDTLLSIGNLTFLYQVQGRYEESVRLGLEVLETRRRTLGHDHPDTLNSMSGLAGFYASQGRYEDAERLAAEALALQRRVLGEEHPDTLHSMGTLAAVYGFQGRSDEAEPLFVETLETLVRTLGEDHPRTLHSMNNLASLYTEQGRFDEARQLLERALASKNADPAFIHSLGELLLATGDLKEAEVYLRQALEVYESRGGDEFLGLALYQLAGLAARDGKRAEALALLRRAAASGYVDESVADDLHLVSLHGDPEFEAIVAEVKKRIGEE